MLNILTQQTSGYAFGLGASLVGLVLVLVVLGFLFSLAHQFVYDEDKLGPNPALKLFLKDQVKFYPIIWGEGFNRPNKIWKYVKEKEYANKTYEEVKKETPITYYEHEVVRINQRRYNNFWACLGLMFFAPFTALVALEIYPVVLFVGTVTALLHLARFTVRLKKKFTSHTIDPNAHKEVTNA